LKYGFLINLARLER